MSRRVVKIEAILSSLDGLSDAELESIAQQAIDDTHLDIEECSIKVMDYE